jgi:hypothetical protein
VQDASALADLEYSPTLLGFVPFGTVATATATVAPQPGDVLSVRYTCTYILPDDLAGASLTIGGLAGQSPQVILPEGATLAAGVNVVSGGSFQLGANTQHPNALNPARLTGDLTIAAGGQAVVVDGAFSGNVAPTGTLNIRNNATLLASASLTLPSLVPPLPVVSGAAGTLTMAGEIDTASLLGVLTNQTTGGNPLFNGSVLFTGTLDNSGTVLPLGNLGGLHLSAATVLGGTVGGAEALAGCTLEGVSIAGLLTTTVGSENTVAGSIGGYGTLVVDGTLALGGATTLDPATIVLGTGGLLTGGPTSLVVGAGGAIAFEGAGSVDLAATAVSFAGTLDTGDNAAPTGIAWSDPGGSLAFGPNGLLRAGLQSTLRLDSAVVGAPPVLLAGGTLDVVQSVTLGDVSFASAGATLMFEAAGSNAVLVDFADGDAIVFPGDSDLGTSLALQNNTLELLGSGETLEARFALARSDGGGYSASNFNLGIGDDGLTLSTTGISITACYAAGTRLETAAGPRAVERIRPGDRLRTAGGGLREVIWTGRRRLCPARHPRPWDVAPVRVRAHAFGRGMPQRDLVLSPDHGVFAEGVLMPIRYLVNGATVVQEVWDSVTYHHVELDRHDIILAEGLPAESYLDTGNRDAFDAGAVVMLHPEFARAAWARKGFARLATAGGEVARVRARLRVRALARGYRLTDAPALAIRPLGSGQVIESRSFVPAEASPDNHDHRRLGVAVTGLAVDGELVPLDDPRLGAGWHAPESSLRWTDGAGHIAVPPGARLDVTTVSSGALYWLHPAAERPQRSRGREAKYEREHRILKFDKS